MKYKIVPALSFDFLTPFYNTFSNVFGYGNLLKRKVIGLIRLDKDDNLLDIGCGTGILVILAKRRFPEAKVSGIDADDKILQIAKKEISKNKLDISLMQSRAEKLPFPDNSMHYVTSSLVFHHLPTVIKKQAMREIYRVLQPGGSFLLVDLGKSRTWRQKLFYFLVSPFEEGKYMQDNIHGRLPVFMEKAGFTVSSPSPTFLGMDLWLGKK